MCHRILIAAVIAALPVAAQGQSIQKLTNPAPDGAQETWQLTDGTVLAQSYRRNNEYWVLTPDNTGSYVNGTWKQVGSLPSGYSPTDMASQVLADGRVLIEGGEYNQGKFVLTNMGAVYDPTQETWMAVDPPKGWQNIGDSPSVVLPDGRFLLGDKLHMRGAALDPKTMQWSPVGYRGKNDFNAEEGWTLLPDGKVLTLDVLDAPRAEEYSARRQEWRAIPPVPVDLHSPTTVVGCVTFGPGGSLCYYPPGEIGPAMLRPDGTVFATGSFANDDPNLDPNGAGHTAIYDTHTRTWTQGPDFPIVEFQGQMYGDNAGDEFAVLLPNGKVLVEGFIAGYEFDGTNFVQTVSPSVYIGSLSVLPSGEVLFGGYAPGGFPAQLYKSPGRHDPAWEPVVLALDEENLQPGSTYRAWGFQFNGLSEAAAFGDELQAAQNYPLVRITNDATHHVFYARTHDHSTMGVATGYQIVSTSFDVPQQIETGSSQLEVVANGIASHPVHVWVRSGH